MSILMSVKIGWCLFVFTDVHFLLVIAVSVVLCVACFCFLVQAYYRRKHQYRGKQRELQRPFLKGKRGAVSPSRSPLLFGNLVSFGNNIITFTDAISMSSLVYSSVEACDVFWVWSAFIKIMAPINRNEQVKLCMESNVQFKPVLNIL